MITADSTRDLPYKLLSLLDQRIALRLPDLYDYSDLLGGRVSAQIPSTLPGRALCVLPEHGVLDCHIALPLLTSLSVNDDTSEEQATVLESEMNDELKATAAELAAAWTGAPKLLPPAVRLLPDQVALEDLGPAALARESVTGTLRAPLGLESIGLDVAALLLNRDTPHALVLGPRRSGKTTALRSLAVALARRYSAEELRLVIIDPHKGGLAGLNGLPHVAYYARSEAQIAALVGVLDQLRRTHPHGERWVVIVDDYNIGRTMIKSQFAQVYTGEPNLYSVLEDLATGGGELGIHLIVAANITYADEGVIKRLDEARTGVILWPNRYDPGTKLLGVGLPVGERGAETTPGRALLVHEDDQMLVQIAHVSEADIAARAVPAPMGTDAGSQV